MACGRLKNLEIAAGNLLCGRCKRRRNFLTTGNGNWRRGNPEPPGQGETRSHPQRGNSALWPRGNSGPPVKEKTPSCGGGETLHHGEAETLRPPGTEGLGPVGGGETPSRWRRENSGPPARDGPGPLVRGSPSPPGERPPRAIGQERFGATRRRGNPAPRQGGPWSHRRRGNPEPVAKRELRAIGDGP